MEAYLNDNHKVSETIMRMSKEERDKIKEELEREARQEKMKILHSKRSERITA